VAGGVGVAGLKRPGAVANLAIAGGLLALNVALNVPLFEAGETPYRGSIEGGYAGMARFFSQNPNPWGWNPTQYCGLPAQFTYLPGLPYLAGAISRIAPRLPPDYAYRILASTLACLGPATLFLFVVYFTRSRWWALGAALAYTFYSPSYYLVHTIDVDRGKSFLPWRLQALVKYGEGPHNAGLTLIPLALIAVWRAAVSRGFAPIFLAATLLGAVTLTNWVAALALACCCLLMLVSLAGSSAVTGFRAGRVFAAAGLAYGLACFWLTPSFIRTIAFNWPADAFNYQLLGPQRLLLAGLPCAVLVLRLGLGKIFPRQYYLWFVTLSLLAFGWVTLWFYARGLNTVPESRRYALEMEMFLALTAFELLRLAMRAPIAPLRFFAVYAALAVFLSGWGQVRSYITQGFDDRRPAAPEGFIEYRAAKRLAELAPQGRVFASGGLRFRLNSWYPIPQVGGGFESGLSSRAPLSLSFQIRSGDGVDAVRELRTLGVEYVVVHGPKSREYYRDFKNPQKFDGLLERVWREEDDTIYRVPFSSLAHVANLAGVSEPDAGGTLAVAWRGSSEVHVGGAIPEGRVVSLKVNYDPGWRAAQDGRPIAVERDRLGYMVLRANASPAANIELRFRGSVEQRVMAALSAITWIGSIAAVMAGKRSTGYWKKIVSLRISSRSNMQGPGRKR
jgi:hypothetical protein